MSETVTLDELIDDLLRDMKAEGNVTEDYVKMMDQLSKLYKLKEIQDNLELKKVEQKSRKFGISPDTLAVVGANIVGIVAVLYHERVNVITSKALGFIIKAR
jgi:hypothetical protein